MGNNEILSFLFPFFDVHLKYTFVDGYLIDVVDLSVENKNKNYPLISKFSVVFLMGIKMESKDFIRSNSLSKIIY